MTKKIVYLTSLLLTLFVNQLFAEKLTKTPITGLHRIEAKAVTDYLKLKVGDDITPEKVEESLKRLYETGWFSDVRLNVDKSVLQIKVVENPTVNKVAFEGNDTISDTILKEEVQIKPRDLLTQDLATKEMQRILTFYQRKGYYAATVEPKIIKRDQNRVDVVFVIQEGVMTTINAIQFVGAHQFSQSELEGEIHSKEARWYRFLTATDTYDPERLEADKYALKSFYAKKGYINLAILSGGAELFPDKSGFLLTFMFEEGKRYKIKEIRYDVHIPGIKLDVLKEDLPIMADTWYNGDAVEETKQILSDRLGDLGYAFVTIDHVYAEVPGKQEVILTFKVNESPKVYIERIEIYGNTKTLDSVIRREMLVKEGDPFNTTKIRESLRNIRSLGYFKAHKLRQENARGSSANKLILKLYVEEEGTLIIGFAIGYNTLGGKDNFLKGIEVKLNFTERNFLGYGIETKFQYMQSMTSKEFSIGASDQHLFAYRVGGGVDLFYSDDDRTQVEAYLDNKFGGSAHVRYALADDFMQRLTYTLYSQTMTLSKNANVSRHIKDMADGKNKIVSKLTLASSYDKRDNPMDPSSGYVLVAVNDLAGLAGDISFFKTDLKSAYHIPLAEKVVFNLRASGGMIFGENLRIADTFQKGAGDSIHGFEAWGIGPRLSTVGGRPDSLGGKTYYIGAAELSIPIGGPELGVKFLLYTEVGDLWDCAMKKTPGEEIVNESFTRVSIGTGLALTIPMLGRIRLDWAQPIRHTDYDKQQNFSFGMDYKI